MKPTSIDHQNFIQMKLSSLSDTFCPYVGSIQLEVYVLKKTRTVRYFYSAMVGNF